MRSPFTFTLFLLSIILLYASCQKELKLPGTGEPKIVIIGELTANDTVCLRAGQSVPIRSGPPLSVGLIKDLQMAIEQNGIPFMLNGAEDDLSAALVTIPYSANYLIKPGASYSVRGLHNSLGEVTAQVAIPHAFTASVIDTASVVFGGEDALKFTIQINDPASGGERYAIEATHQTYMPIDYFLFNGQWLSINDYFFTYDSLKSLGIAVPEKTEITYSKSSTRAMLATDDPVSEQLLRGYGGNNVRRILLSDQNFTGGTHITHVYIAKSALLPGLGYRTLLQVKSVSDDYYRFLNSYEQYDPALGYNNSSAPVRVQGNVVNGLGMVGGVYRQQFSYYF